MNNSQELRDELARLTRHANQLASDLADTRTRIRALVAALGMPKISVYRQPALIQPGNMQYGPAIAVTEGLPEPWKSVRLILPDGTKLLGVWTGFEWWSQGRLQQPTHWEDMRSPGTSTEMRAASA